MHHQQPHHGASVTNHFGGVVACGQFDDSMSAVACSSMMSSISAPPLYSTTHFYDSSGVAMTAVPVPGSSSSATINVALGLGPRTREWEDFHTVPPSRDYL